MQISVSIEPYLVVEKIRLTQYIEKIIQVSKKIGQDKVSLHFDYFKANPEVFNLVQGYTDQIDIDLHLMHEPAPSVDGFRSISFDVVDLQEKNQKMLSNLKTVEPIRCGLYLDLGTDIQNCADLVRTASWVIIMTVKCGKSGQTFQAPALPLAAQVRKLNPNAVIIIDGGVNENNIQLLRDAGVDVAVIGNYAKKFYENDDLITGINRLLHD